MKELSSLNLGGLLTKPTVGSVSEIELDLIVEDSNNARKDFNEESLNELAESIKHNGVIAPISVREHPLQSGRYIINHGHRRFRASRIAGKTKIPAFLDSKIDDFGRFIENIQREELSPLDIANQLNIFIKDGMSGREIAERLGKSDSWVSRHLGLLSAPIVIKKSLEDGKIKSVEAAKTLASLSNEHPVEVQDFLVNTQGEVTQKQVREFSKELKGAPAVEVNDSEMFVLEVDTEPSKAEIDISQSKTDRSLQVICASTDVLLVELFDVAKLTEKQKEAILEELSDDSRFDKSFDALRFYLQQMNLDI